MGKDITVGMDMGDKEHVVCILDSKGKVIKRDKVRNTGEAIRKYFKKLAPCRMGLEAGTHSGWVSRILEEVGHEVLVGNPRKLRMIWKSNEKDDNKDAEMIARLTRADPQLLHPIQHRGAEAQIDLGIIKARDMLVKSRSMLIGHARGAVKSIGERISKCSAETFHRRLNKEMPEELRSALEPLMKMIEELTGRIRDYDKVLKKLCREKYAETEGLQAICGVGPITSLAFVLTLEESSRFDNSRSVGAFVGLVPKRDQSGETDKQLRITKAGDAYLRRLLVGSAQYILGHFGPDCDLREFGLKLAQRGGKNAKRRAVVAVARKLAVLMHHLWKADAIYDPFYQKNRKQRNKAA
jgi:transposase